MRVYVLPEWLQECYVRLLLIIHIVNINRHNRHNRHIGYNTNFPFRNHPISIFLISNRRLAYASNVQ